MGTLEEIITAINLLFGYLCLRFLFYLAEFFDWLKSSREMLLVQTTQILLIVLISLGLVVAFFLLRRWINAQLVLQKNGQGKKGVSETIVKANNYGSRFLAFFLLIESIYTGAMIYRMFQMIDLIAEGNVPEELIATKPDLWIIIPLIAQVVLVMHGAFSLFAQKSVAVLSLAMAMIVSLIGLGFYFYSGIQYIGGVLIYITITRVLPLAYTIFLLRNGKLNSKTTYMQ